MYQNILLHMSKHFKEQVIYYISFISNNIMNSPQIRDSLHIHQDYKLVRYSVSEINRTKSTLIIIYYYIIQHI